MKVAKEYQNIMTERDRNIPQCHCYWLYIYILVVKFYIPLPHFIQRLSRVLYTCNHIYACNVSQVHT